MWIEPIDFSTAEGGKGTDENTTLFMQTNLHNPQFLHKRILLLVFLELLAHFKLKRLTF